MAASYTTIGEKYCISAGKNIAVETIHHSDGTQMNRCLNQSCQSRSDSVHCFLKNHFDSTTIPQTKTIK